MLIKCPECGKKISDSAYVCVICGYPIEKLDINKSGKVCLKNVTEINKTNWVKIRMGFGIATLAVGIMFLLMIMTSKGGIENNIRMVGTAWFLLWCGFLGILGKRKRWATILSVVFYSIGILYNMIQSIFCTAHLFVALIMIVFLIFISISLTDRKGFK